MPPTVLSLPHCFQRRHREVNYSWLAGTVGSVGLVDRVGKLVKNIIDTKHIIDMIDHMTITQYIESIHNDSSIFDDIKCEVEMSEELKPIVDDAMKRIDNVRYANLETYFNVLRDIIIELLDSSNDEQYDALMKHFKLDNYP